MQEIVRQILTGNVEYESGLLDFSCTKIDITLQKGVSYEGSFTISAGSQGLIKGFVCSSDFRMECQVKELYGTQAEIPFVFHGADTEEGDVIKGSFLVVSNIGEYYLPFVISVERTYLPSSVGPIKNLFHFANLAKENWQEALKMFYTPEFASVFSGTDKQFYEIYQGLSCYPGNEQNLEEFLIRIHKKQKVEYILEERRLTVELTMTDDLSEAIQRQLHIIRNGWGYQCLSVSCEGEFLFLTQKSITDDNFLGNRCTLPVYIDPSVLKEGKNQGRIRLDNAYESIVTEVTVILGERSFVNDSARKWKKVYAKMMESYQDFRMKRIGTADWLKANTVYVDELMVLNEKDVIGNLYKAQLLITEERFNEANWVLDHSRDILLSQKEGNVYGDELGFKIRWSYYLYLTTLVDTDESYIRGVTTEVERNYIERRDCWQIGWLLLYMSSDYNKTPTDRWQFLEKLFYYGCSSFIIYIEALTLLNGYPTLLRKLDAFELQVVFYGVRQGVLSQDVVEQFHYLIGRMKGKNRLAERILLGLYEKKPETWLLQEICTLYIKEGRTQPAYFKWYEAGVREQLRITNLYEYYMMSFDKNEKIEFPKAVLLYFSYQNQLDYERAACLYDYLLQNKDSYANLYAQYEECIRDFVLEQIKKERIDRHLAALYTAILTPDMIDAGNAPALSKLLFANRIVVNNSRYKKVIVYHKDVRIGREYPLNAGEAWISLYGSDYTILFEDAEQNRYASEADYTLEKLMLAGKYIPTLYHYVVDIPELNLFFAGMGDNAEAHTDCVRERAGLLASKEDISPAQKQVYLMQLLSAFYEGDRIDQLYAALQTIDYDILSREQRSQCLKYLVLLGQNEQALSLLNTYGPYFAQESVLLRLLSAILPEEADMPNRLLMNAAYFVFAKGKYNGTILQYLCKWYEGRAKELRNIWKAADSFGVDCYSIAERFLVQMMFTGVYVGETMEVFSYYVSQGASREVEEAFLMRSAHDYFVGEKVTDEFIFREIFKLYKQKEEVRTVCKLALLKYCAEEMEPEALLTDPMAEAIAPFLKEMMDQKIHLNFFRKLSSYTDGINQLKDKTIIEYRAKPRARARIHYVLLREDKGAENYLSEYMKDVYGGVCFMEFILFFGETLQYYITEEYDEEETLTESDSIQKNNMGDEGQNNRYDKVNDIVISKTLKDYDTLDSAVEEYLRLQYANVQLFQLK